MAKQDKAAKPEKKQGTFRRLGAMYRMTMKADKQAIWVALGFVAMSLGLGFIAANLLNFGNSFSYWTWIITGILGGFLAFLITMSRRAERVMYSNIEGQQGAVGAVLTSALKRNWRVSERPVAIAPKTFDAVYRAVGPAGVILVAEGSRSRLRPMLEDEKRKIQRVASGVPIDVVYICGDDESIRLHSLVKTIYKMKRKLNRSEVSAVANRLATLPMNIPVPKGIDPTKFRAPRR